MRDKSIPEGYWKSLRLLAADAVLSFDIETARLGNGPTERGEIFDLYAARWRQVEMRLLLDQPLPRFVRRPEMVWAGMARFLGSMLASNADLLDFGCVLSTYSDLREEFGDQR